MKTAAIIALAGLATVASAQVTATVMLTHDDADGIINIGDSVTWTLSVAHNDPVSSTVSGGNMVITGDNSLGNSSDMAYTPVNGGNGTGNGNPFNSGGSNGAGIAFVNWTNSLFLEAFGNPADHSNPFVAGTFTFTATAAGTLNYAITKGPADSAFTSVAQSAFAETLFDTTADAEIQVQSLTIVPTPASAALLGLGGLVAVRRRR